MPPDKLNMFGSFVILEYAKTVALYSSSVLLSNDISFVAANQLNIISHDRSQFKSWCNKKENATKKESCDWCH